MNENLTEIAFVLDRSGSMADMKNEAIGGFNHFLTEQKNAPGDVRLTLVLFDHEYDKVIDHQPLNTVKPLDDTLYEPRGTTALLDAMGRTIDEVGQRLSDLPENDRPGKVIIACMTDGFENSSKHYDNAKVASMIEHQRTKYSWEFVFLGATIESRTMARSWTIASADISAFAPTAEGVFASHADMSKRLLMKRSKYRSE